MTAGFTVLHIIITSKLLSSCFVFHTAATLIANIEPIALQMVICCLSKLHTTTSEEETVYVLYVDFWYEFIVIYSINNVLSLLLQVDWITNLFKVNSRLFLLIERTCMSVTFFYPMQNVDFCQTPLSNRCHFKSNFLLHFKSDLWRLASQSD